ncbi:MAG TPA: class I SAM-dependent methyltransferase [Pirellulales bacterium]|nr:class I SAM-dependent methyltransferase [Pirellulales bacterium]
MARCERTHWWYLGLRDLLARLIDSRRPTLPRSPRVLDAGCGTGANLRLLSDLLEPEQVHGFDRSMFAVQRAAQLCPEAQLRIDDLCSPAVESDCFDVIISCDVCSVPGLAACRHGLRRLSESLRRGGILILHLPAYEWLYSAHDRAVGHTQRFSLREVTSLVRGFGLSVELASYRMSLLFPAIVACRVPTLFRDRTTLAPRSDLGKPNGWLNAMLFRIVQHENIHTARGWRWPFGSSIVVLARKPARRSID